MKTNWLEIVSKNGLALDLVPTALKTAELGACIRARRASNALLAKGKS
jgi:hypothetical protein